MAGIPGRKPKPTALKEMAGNPGKRPISSREPKPEAFGSKMPEGLPIHGQIAWLRLVSVLEPMGLLTEADALALEDMCLHYGFMKSAAASLRRLGITIIDKDGITRKNPAHQIFREHSAAFRQWATEFGLTPSSRTRLEMPDTGKKSLAEMLFDATEEGQELHEETLADAVGGKAADALASIGVTSVEVAKEALRHGIDLTMAKGVGPATVRKLEGA